MYDAIPCIGIVSSSSGIKNDLTVLLQGEFKRRSWDQCQGVYNIFPYSTNLFVLRNILYLYG